MTGLRHIVELALSSVHGGTFCVSAGPIAVECRLALEWNVTFQRQH